jgi:phosphatidylglycerophosphate synthase
MIHLRLTPNKATAIGAIIATMTPFIMATGAYLPFGVIVFIVGFFDGVDGAIARISRTVTKWGGFLDSVLDRYGDSLILISYLFLPVTAPLGETVVLAIQFRLWIYLSIVGSLMVSYTRAKGEAVGATHADVGIAGRSERLLLLSLSAIMGILNVWILIYGLVAVAILANFTAMYRIGRITAFLKKEEGTPKIRAKISTSKRQTVKKLR